jgi:hypothetical protein
MARYAVITLSLPANVMRSLPLLAPPCARASWLTESLFPKKSALLSLVTGRGGCWRELTWLKNTEINTLKSL